MKWLTNFKGCKSEERKDIAPQSHDILQIFVSRRTLTCPQPYINVCKISRLYRAISWLVFHKTLSNLATTLILRLSLQLYWRIFTNWSFNTWKNHGNFYYWWVCCGIRPQVTPDQIPNSSFYLLGCILSVLTGGTCIWGGMGPGGLSPWGGCTMG